MSDSTLAHPAGIMDRLDDIDSRLAVLADEFEPVAKAWFEHRKKRDEAYAKAYVAATGNHSERRELALLASSGIGVDEEAAWEGKRAVLKTLETRSMVGASLLKLQTRMGA
jgi:hypothetical protein